MSSCAWSHRCRTPSARRCSPAPRRRAIAEAHEAFSRRHLCRIPYPEPVERALGDARPSRSTTQLWGPDGFTIEGSLADWDVCERDRRDPRSTLITVGATTRSPVRAPSASARASPAASWSSSRARRTSRTGRSAARSWPACGGSCKITERGATGAGPGARSWWLQEALERDPGRPCPPLDTPGARGRVHRRRWLHRPLDGARAPPALARQLRRRARGGHLRRRRLGPQRGLRDLVVGRAARARSSASARQQALVLAEASTRAIREIGEFHASRGIPGYRQAGNISMATCRAQVGSWRATLEALAQVGRPEMARGALGRRDPRRARAVRSRSPACSFPMGPPCSRRSTPAACARPRSRQACASTSTRRCSRCAAIARR